MKKILFIIDRLNDGAGRVVYDLAKNLDKDKFECAVVSIYKEGNLVEEFRKSGVKVINLGKRGNLGTVLKLRKIIKKEKADIVHTHNVDAYEYGVLGARLAGVKKIFHTAHGKSVKIGKFRRLREKIYHKMISVFLSKYIVVSNDLGKYVSKNWCSNKKMMTIYNGIDVKKYKKIKVKKDFLYKLGVDKKDKLIGIVAGLRPVKDHITLIKSMHVVNKEIPDSKLLIVGDGPERKKLEEFSDRFGLSENVLFLGNRKDTVKLYNCIDIGVLCSLSECLSITLLEGMSCEVPFIATAVGGNPEVIDNGKDGFLVPVRNSDVLTGMIIQMLKSKKLRKNVGKEAREKVVKEFGVNRMIKEHDKIYFF